jgi:hypothetical protein
MRALALAAALAASLAFVPAASAAPWTPPKPPKGHATFKWNGYGCKTVNGVHRVYGTFDSWVHKLKEGFWGQGLHFQKVKVQIDREWGYGGNGKPKWKQVYGKSGVKKLANGDQYYFQRDIAGAGGLPDGIEMTASTGVFPSTGQLSVKATVWLKQWGHPKAVWRYKKRTPSFDAFNTCRTEQLPSSNGGGNPITEIG